MKKAMIFALGGTISMGYDETSGGLVPCLKGEDLIKELPLFEDVDQLETVNFSEEPSSRITPQVMLELAKALDAALIRKDIAGAVVTHGTDTLEETAYFLDLYINSSKPVCVTGAMRSFGEISPDGSANMTAALRTVLSEKARNMGVLVVMNDEIHAAADVVKTHSSSLKTFASPFWGPLGYADTDRIIFKRRPLGRLNIRPQRIEAEVPLISLYTGMDNSVLDFLFNKKPRALVLEAFGRGNMSNVHVPVVRKFIEVRIPVIIATRTFGRVLDLYAYSGGVKELKNMGAITAGEITAAKARLKALMALSAGVTPENLGKYFDTD